MKFSLLVPRKADHGIRDHHWSLVKKRYKKHMSKVEICTGYDNSDLFCRAKAVNRAAKKATGNILIIVDADVIFEPELLEKIAAVINLHPWIIPYKNAIFLTKKATNRFINKGLPAKVKIKAEDIERSYLGKGQLINVMKRECFEAVQGLDERFNGWGLEDFAFRVSLDTICGKHFNMEQNVYHLWHPRAKRNHLNAPKNKNLYLRYLEAEDDVIKMNNLICERIK